MLACSVETNIVMVWRFGLVVDGGNCLSRPSTFSIVVWQCRLLPRTSSGDMFSGLNRSSTFSSGVPAVSVVQPILRKGLRIRKKKFGDVKTGLSS